ncbi:MAG: Asp-tRNA(Asn)/Glu-tRNA(Gln) amidotransferase subunit GatC [Limibacillus sp.]|jgi:aspartyl-tRNA(Asn)/glutamyl-tRNA(Gln) amidotransferase subunit C
MAVDKDTVTKIARLARIRVADEEKEALAGELSQILGFVEQLGEIDTDGVPPMTSVVETKPPLREDKVTDGGYPDKIVANAPEAAENFFAVPKVVE